MQEQRNQISDDVKLASQLLEGTGYEVRYIHASKEKILRMKESSKTELVLSWMKRNAIDEETADHLDETDAEDAIESAEQLGMSPSDFANMWQENINNGDILFMKLKNNSFW